MAKPNGRRSNDYDYGPRNKFPEGRVRKVIDVQQVNDELYFGVLWENSELGVGIIPAEEAHNKIPQLIIKFFESICVFVHIENL